LPRDSRSIVIDNFWSTSSPNHFYWRRKISGQSLITCFPKLWIRNKLPQSKNLLFLWWILGIHKLKSIKTPFINFTKIKIVLIYKNGSCQKHENSGYIRETWHKVLIEYSYLIWHRTRIEEIIRFYFLIWFPNQISGCPNTTMVKCAWDSEKESGEGIFFKRIRKFSTWILKFLLQPKVIPPISK